MEARIIQRGGRGISRLLFIREASRHSQSVFKLEVTASSGQRGFRGPFDFRVRG